MFCCSFEYQIFQFLSGSVLFVDDVSFIPLHSMIFIPRVFCSFGLFLSCVSFDDSGFRLSSYLFHVFSSMAVRDAVYDSCISFHVLIFGSAWRSVAPDINAVRFANFF